MKVAELKKIVTSAVYAPSGDNCQPLTFKWKDDCLHIEHDPERSKADINYRNIATYVHLGACLENISLSAKALGYEMSWELMSVPSPEDFKALVRFSPAQKEVSELLDAVPKRHTNRHFYKACPLTNEVMSDLINSVDTIEHATTSIINYSSRMKKMAKAYGQFDSLIFENKGCYDGLFQWIRWDKDEVANTSDGMPLDTLGLNPMEKMTFRLMRSWKLTQIFASLGFGFFSRIRAKILYLQSGALGIICVPNLEPHSLINAGRHFQRVWLHAEAHGLAMQPITGAPLFAARFLDGGVETLSSGHIEHVKSIKNELEQLLGNFDRTYPVLGYRIGEAKKKIVPRAKRFSLDDVLTLEGDK